MTGTASITKRPAQRLPTAKKGVNMKYTVKFEWIFAVMLMLACCSIIIWGPSEAKMPAAMALVSGFSGSVGYIYGKTAPDK